MYARSTRPHRRPPVVRRIPRTAAISRGVAGRPGFVGTAAQPDETAFSALSQPDPYVDYGRFLTPEGGVLFIYKDLDLRWRYLIWRVLAWSAMTAYEGWHLGHHSPVHSCLIKIVCFLAIAAVNYLIVRKPIEVYRRAEVRPDCLVLESGEVFWLRLMEKGPPAFSPDKERNLVLRGIYGTRLVEYLVARRFDENDRMPDVFAAHLAEAMHQLWATALMRGTVRRDSRRRQSF